MDTLHCISCTDYLERCRRENLHHIWKLMDFSTSSYEFGAQHLWNHHCSRYFQHWYRYSILDICIHISDWRCWIVLHLGIIYMSLCLDQRTGVDYTRCRYFHQKEGNLKDTLAIMNHIQVLILYNSSSWPCCCCRHLLWKWIGILDQKDWILNRDYTLHTYCYKSWNNGVDGKQHSVLSYRRVYLMGNHRHFHSLRE